MNVLVVGDPERTPDRRIVAIGSMEAMRVEDLVLVTNDGFERRTDCTHDLEVVSA